MSRLSEQMAIGFSVPKENETLSGVLTILDESIKAETSLALGPIDGSEKRAWQCGRADALAAFKEVLIAVRQEALKQRGLPVE
jgi:hypothetical protein